MQLNTTGLQPYDPGMNVTSMDLRKRCFYYSLQLSTECNNYTHTHTHTRGNAKTLKRHVHITQLGNDACGQYLIFYVKNRVWSWCILQLIDNVTLINSLMCACIHKHQQVKCSMPLTVLDARKSTCFKNMYTNSL